MMNTQFNNEGKVRDLSHISQFRTARNSVMKAKALSRNASMQQPNHADCNKRVEAWQSSNVGNRFKAKAVCQQTISKTVSRKNGLQAKQSPGTTVSRQKPQCFCAFRADKTWPGSNKAASQITAEGEVR